MAEPRIRPKRSSTSSSVPLAAQLSEGELAINLADGKIYSKNSAGTVVQLATSATTATTATYIAGGAGGSIPYQSSANTTAMLANGTSGQLLKSNGGTAAPSWYTITKSDVSLGNVENTALSTWAGTTNITTVGTISSGTWSGTAVAATKGGTGQTTFTLGDVLYSSASNTLSKLSGNTTATKKFLRQTGTGTVSAAPAWDTVTSSDVGLGNVEDTALSTWTGSANITTVGTLSALTVSGTTVINSLTYPSTDGTSGQALVTNGAGTLSWATASGSAAGGSQGDIQYNDGSGGFTAGSYFNYGTSAYDALALYSSNASLGVFGIFGASGQTYPLLEFRDYTGGTVYSYFDATGNLYLNAQTDIRFADADSSNYAAIQAPTTIATNYTLTLPTTAGTNNYVLKTDGSGNLSWTNYITSLAGGNSTTLLGSVPYQSNSNTTTLLSPNTTTTKKFLRQTGTGTNGAAPAWDTVVAADIASGQIALAYGGTNANLTAVNGAVAYSTASALALTAAGTSGQVLTSGGAASPTWVNQGLFSSGRLTLESGVPVSTSDQTSKTTIYYTPYNGDRISLYDGTNWATYTFTERSLSLGTLTSGKNYDVFLYNNSGTLTLELSAAWTSDTARSDALTLTNGVYVKSSSTTRRYLGTIRTTSTTTTEDSATKRLVWNFNNRVSKNIYVADANGSWTYTTAAWRYANNNSNNKIEFVAGIALDSVFCNLTVTTYATTAIVAYYPSAALNSASGIPLYTSSGQAYTSGSLTWFSQRHSNMSSMPQTGYNYIAWLEYAGGATGTITVSGSNDGSKMLGAWIC